MLKLMYDLSGSSNSVRISEEFLPSASRICARIKSSPRISGGYNADQGFCICDPSLQFLAARWRRRRVLTHLQEPTSLDGVQDARRNDGRVVSAGDNKACIKKLVISTFFTFVWRASIPESELATVVDLGRPDDWDFVDNGVHVRDTDV